MSDAQRPDAPEDDLPEQMRVRREKRAAAARVRRCRRTRSTSSARTRSPTSATRYDDAGLEPDSHTGEQVSVVGRVIFLRNTGKLCFVRLREGDGTELQVMLSLADVGEEALAEFKALVDLGDLLAVTGRGRDQPARRAVRAGDRVVDRRQDAPAAPQRAPAAVGRGEGPAALRRHDACGPEPREMVRTKATVLKSLRSTLDERGYVEVETPDPAAHQRRRRGSAVPHAPQRASTRRCCCGSRSSSTSRRR